MLAQEESRRLGHNFVGTEQILLGLIGEGRGVASRRLHAAGVTLQAARVEVEKIIGRGSGFVAVEIPFTPRAKRVLELSWDEARRLHHDYIGTEHLLLGLIREGEGVAGKVLKVLNVNTEQLRSQVLAAIGKNQSALLPAEPLIPEDTGNMHRSEVFTWYDEQAILTVQRAWGIAETTGAKCIEPQHLLLADLRDAGTISSALAAAQVKLGDLRRQIFQSVDFDDTAPSQALPFSQSSKKVLADAWKIAVAQKLFLTKECLFLALLNDEDGVLSLTLKAMAIDTAAIRKSVEEAIKPPPPLPDPPPEPVKDTKPVGMPAVRFRRLAAGSALYLLVAMAVVLFVVHLIAPAAFESLAISVLIILMVGMALWIVGFGFK